MEPRGLAQRGLLTSLSTLARSSGPWEEFPSRPHSSCAYWGPGLTRYWLCEPEKPFYLSVPFSKLGRKNVCFTGAAVRIEGGGCGDSARVRLKKRVAASYQRHCCLPCTVCGGHREAVRGGAWLITLTHQKYLPWTCERVTLSTSLRSWLGEQGDASIFR